MPVSSASNRSRESLSSGVDSLPDVLKVNSASHFLDQNRGKSHLSESLMSAEEVDLSHGHIFALDSNIYRNSRDESPQFVLLGISNSNKPVLMVAGRSESPLEESS